MKETGLYASTIFNPRKRKPGSISLPNSVKKLQALWRGYLCRKRYKFLTTLSVPKHSYFSKNDLLSTLSGAKINIPISIKLQNKSYTYPSGAVYTGDWLSGFRHGKGTIKWPDGCGYTGNWSFGLPSGQGKFTYWDSDKYEGTWSSIYYNIDDKNNGYAWLSNKHETINSFEQNHKTIIKEINDRHEKNLKQFIIPKQTLEKVFSDYKNLAVNEISKGIRFQGSIISGLRQGYGRNVWENGDVYEGEWVNDTQSGWGRNIWVDGSSYIGMYKNNQKDGIGEYFWEDGTAYIGEWKDNNIHGIGKYSWADGRMYLGYWNQGVMHGFGLFSWKDGRKYEGFWKDGKKEGIGITFAIDGSSHTDKWIGGKIVKKRTNF
jgi:hypothetical protein